MQYCQASPGRIFVLRLEDGDVLHEVVERFARDQGVSAAALLAVGGADSGSRLVVGPEQGRSHPVNPMHAMLDNVHEIAGTGTVFPNEQGEPVLHMHLAAGRNGSTVTGCVREGVKTWHIIEIVLWELTGCEAKRVRDDETGFSLLRCG